MEEYSDEIINERFALCCERLEQIPGERLVWPAFGDYFARAAGLLLRYAEEYRFVASGGPDRASFEELLERNHQLYADLMPEAYEENDANPSVAVSRYGTEYGRLLSCLAAELHSLAAYAWEQDLWSMVIRMELFLEVYHSFTDAWAQADDRERTRCRDAMRDGRGISRCPGLPDPEALRSILYYFASDYAQPWFGRAMRDSFDWNRDFALRIVMDSDLRDPGYLCRYGEYVSDNEIKMAAYLNRLPEEEIARIADVYTEGYRIGFAVTGKDISIKRSVNIRYFIGFERVVRRAVRNFEAMGLHAVIYRAPVSFFEGRKPVKTGYFSTPANRQFEYDHEQDLGLILDKKLKNRRLECYRAAIEGVSPLAGVHGGPAVIECFGEEDFSPCQKEEAISYTPYQQKLLVEYAAQTGALMNTHVRGGERSYTIISFPLPSIGERFEEIFEGVVRINTLDYRLYQGLQQKLIDALDGAQRIHIQGKGHNRTDLTVALHSLEDPGRETNFENCVADVNIPLGEVFTSPRLAGTNGRLHVSRVCLNGVEYRDLQLDFQDGMVTAYTCSNSPVEEENRALIRDKILYHHDTLPMGEFAIGTNTTAYCFARQYGIEKKLPILIAEKMGPHFAVGDTCYSHEEDLITYNPDGKRLIAKENEFSARRLEDPVGAYVNCHTDITIPYDELGELTAVARDGTRTVILRNGRFVLGGCEELNRPLDAMDSASGALTESP